MLLILLKNVIIKYVNKIYIKYVSLLIYKYIFLNVLKLYNYNFEIINEKKL